MHSVMAARCQPCVSGGQGRAEVSSDLWDTRTARWSGFCVCQARWCVKRSMCTDCRHTDSSVLIPLAHMPLMLLGLGQGSFVLSVFLAWAD